MNWEHRNHFQRNLRMILETAHRLDAKGFVAANDGNISARIDSETFICTRSGSVMGRLEPTDILASDLAGKRIDSPFHPLLPQEYRVTSEWKSHSAIYEVRSDVQAIVHAHPPFATAWATARQQLPECVLPEVTVLLREVPLIPFAVPGSIELATFVSGTARVSDVMMLSNHGVIAIGSSIFEALDRLERVEHAAKIMLLSRILNGPVQLMPSEVAALSALFSS